MVDHWVNLAPLGIIIICYLLLVFFTYSYFSDNPYSRELSVPAPSTWDPVSGRAVASPNRKVTLMNYFDGRRVKTTAGKKYHEYRVTAKFTGELNGHFLNGLRHVTMELRGDPNIFITRWKVLMNQDRYVKDNIEFKWEVKRAVRLPPVTTIRFDQDIYTDSPKLVKVEIEEMKNFGRIWTCAPPSGAVIKMLNRGGSQSMENIYDVKLSHKSYPSMGDMDSMANLNFVELLIFLGFIVFFIPMVTVSVPKIPKKEINADVLFFVIGMVCGVVIPIIATLLVFILFRATCKKVTWDMIKMSLLGFKPATTDQSQSQLMARKLFLGLMIIAMIAFFVITGTVAVSHDVKLFTWSLLLVVAMGVGVPVFYYLLFQVEAWFCNSVQTPDEYVAAHQQLMAYNEARDKFEKANSPSPTSQEEVPGGPAAGAEAAAGAAPGAGPGPGAAPVAGVGCEAGQPGGEQSIVREVGAQAAPGPAPAGVTKGIRRASAPNTTDSSQDVAPGRRNHHGPHHGIHKNRSMIPDSVNGYRQ